MPDDAYGIFWQNGTVRKRFGTTVQVPMLEDAWRSPLSVLHEPALNHFRAHAESVSPKCGMSAEKVIAACRICEAGELKYFLESLCGVSYVEVPELAPEAGLLKAYRAKSICWDDYQDAYLNLIRTRRVEQVLNAPLNGSGIALLCSEDTPGQCHRRLAAEYLQQHWKGVVVRHL